MVIYGKQKITINGIERERYTKAGLITRSDRVPPEVKEKLIYADSVKYDDQPELARCLFCDAPQTHQRLVTGSMVYMCDWHYYNCNIGRIVQQLREVEKERSIKEAKDKLQAEKDAAARKLKWKQSHKKKRKVTKKGSHNGTQTKVPEGSQTQGEQRETAQGQDGRQDS